MSKPVVAIVGRPNVGKSTLFNALAGEKISIVKDTPGVTRDRIYADVSWLDKDFTLIDTGGITGDEVGMDEKMAEQSLMAIEEADYVLFLVDARAGMTAADQMIAEHLRKRNKSAILVANKIDNIDADVARAEFSPLGMGNATGKAVEAIARQPEAAGKINSSLMFGLIMMETCAVYALLVGILIVFILGAKA